MARRRARPEILLGTSSGTSSGTSFGTGRAKGTAGDQAMTSTPAVADPVHAAERRRAVGALLGFLLIIIAALAAFLAPGWLAQKRYARQRSTMSALRAIGRAMESYQVDQGAIVPVQARGVP